MRQMYRKVSPLCMYFMDPMQTRHMLLCIIEIRQSGGTDPAYLPIHIAFRSFLFYLQSGGTRAPNSLLIL
jgi:hypothetical protein